MSFLYFFNKRNRTYRRVVWLTTGLFFLFTASAYATPSYTGGSGGGDSSSDAGTPHSFVGGSYGGDTSLEGDAGGTVAAKLAFTTSPSHGVPGGVFVVVVQVQSDAGALCTSATDTVALSLTNGNPAATLGGTTSMAASGGIADFTGKGLYVDKPGDLYTLQASSGLLTPAVSNAFSIAASTNLVVKSELTYDSGSYRINSWLEDSGTIVSNTTFGSVDITISIVDRNGDTVTAPVFDTMMNNSVFRHTWVPPSSGAYTYLANVQITYEGATFAGNFTYNPAVMGGTLATIGTQTAAINWSDVSAIKSGVGRIQAKTDTMNWTDIEGIKTSVGVGVAGGSIADKINTM